MNYPRVSVIITTYNRKGYLEKTLPTYRSVTDYPNYKIIVVDDCSTDGTKELLESWNDGRYFDDYIISSSNLGVTSSRNQGIIRNPADYYALVDDDTKHCNGWLSEAIKILETFSNIGAVTTQRPLWELSEEPEKLSSLDQQLIIDEKTKIQAMIIKYIGSCMVFPHRVWKKVGPFSHPSKRCGICRYSNRISQKSFLVARTYPPFSESIDMPQHKDSLRFKDYFDGYTAKIAPKDMQNIEFYEKGINECKEFHRTHFIDYLDNGIVKDIL
jgi:glycosyltransferase involved in cell wall biosynthesis